MFLQSFMIDPVFHFLNLSCKVFLTVIQLITPVDSTGDHTTQQQSMVLLMTTLNIFIPNFLSLVVEVLIITPLTTRLNRTIFFFLVCSSKSNSVYDDSQICNTFFMFNPCPCWTLTRCRCDIVSCLICLNSSSVYSVKLSSAKIHISFQSLYIFSLSSYPILLLTMMSSTKHLTILSLTTFSTSDVNYYKQE